MNLIQKNQYERAGRVIAFLRQNPDLFALPDAPKPKSAAADRSLLARLTTLQAGMEKTGSVQDPGLTRTQSALAATLHSAAIDRLVKIRRGAETVALQRGTPEILRQFVLGRSRSEAAIQGRMIAVADAIQTLGMEAELGQALLQPDVLPSLRAFIAQFQQGRDNRKSALLKRVGATSGIGALISQARRVVREAEAIVKNRLAPGDERYAAWQSAARVPQAARKTRAAKSASTPDAQPQAPLPAPIKDTAAAPDSLLPRGTSPASPDASEAAAPPPSAADAASSNGHSSALN